MHIVLLDSKNSGCKAKCDMITCLMVEVIPNFSRSSKLHTIVLRCWEKYENAEFSKHCLQSVFSSVSVSTMISFLVLLRLTELNIAHILAANLRIYRPPPCSHWHNFEYFDLKSHLVSENVRAAD